MHLHEFEPHYEKKPHPFNLYKKMQKCAFILPSVFPINYHKESFRGNNRGNS